MVAARPARAAATVIAAASRMPEFESSSASCPLDESPPRSSRPRRRAGAARPLDPLGPPSPPDRSRPRRPEPTSAAAGGPPVGDAEPPAGRRARRPQALRSPPDGLAVASADLARRRRPCPCGSARRRSRCRARSTAAATNGPALRAGAAEQRDRGAPAGRPGGGALGEQGAQHGQGTAAPTALRRPVRARKISPRTAVEVVPSWAAISPWPTPSSSRLTSAWRCASGSAQIARTRRSRSSRCSAISLGPGGDGHRLAELVDAGLAADRVERAVADDREQPGPQRDLAGVGAQGAIGLLERRLDDVLGAVGGDDRGGEGDERAAVAPHDLLEGGLVAVAQRAGRGARPTAPPARDGRSVGVGKAASST